VRIEAVLLGALCGDFPEKACGHVRIEAEGCARARYFSSRLSMLQPRTLEMR
jgi:hypothetical protein